MKTYLDRASNLKSTITFLAFISLYNIAMIVHNGIVPHSFRYVNILGRLIAQQFFEASDIFSGNLLLEWTAA